MFCPKGISMALAGALYARERKILATYLSYVLQRGFGQKWGSIFRKFLDSC
jgi:hypothetical protein